MIQAQTEETLRFHRLRASLPAALWKWKTVMGWRSPEHINVLELRAVLTTTLRWRILKKRPFKTKFVHMIDSLVCLHALSRGRSSSRKLRRTLTLEAAGTEEMVRRTTAQLEGRSKSSASSPKAGPLDLFAA